MIKQNEKTGKFELHHRGRIVCKTASRKYLEKKALSLGITLDTVVQNKKRGRPRAQTTVTPAPVEPSPFNINERFEFISKFVRLVSIGVCNSLIVSGPGGVGKTWTVIDSLQKSGKTELGLGDLDGDYVVVKGNSTAKYLYRTLYENNGKIIIFDDCDSVFKDPIGANLLKSALDSYDKRVITWGAEFSSDEDLPNRFEFIGRVIFISNYSINQIPQALVSRSLKCDVSMTLHDKVERISEVMMAKDFMPKISFDVKREVLRFVKTHAEKFTDLNIRSCQTICKIRNEFGHDWEKMALYVAMS